MTSILVLALVGASGLFSGLTLGYFRLLPDELKRKAELGDRKAKRVFSVRRHGNWLLCTLLVCNVATNASISILLGSLTSGVVAWVVATALIVIFGEIVPKATFARFALGIGSHFTWLAWILMYLLSPVCLPVARLLDRFLGEEMPTVYPKRELIKMVEDQKNSGQSDIDSDEESIVKGALSYSNTRVSEIMTPRSEVVTLKENQKLTKSLLTEIRLTGHSRIPVKSKDTDEIVGLLYTKDLLDKAGKNLTLGEIARRRVYSVTPETQLDDLLNRLRDTHCHLFIVRQKSGGALVGVVTIEDVMEEIIGHEILDEFEKPADTAKI